MQKLLFFLCFGMSLMASTTSASSFPQELSRKGSLGSSISESFVHGQVHVVFERGYHPQSERHGKYRLSLDHGATWSRWRNVRYEIKLRYQEFDPLRDGEPEIPNSLRATSENQLWIVQYTTQGIEAWRDEIRALGGDDVRFLAWQANVWKMNSKLAREVSRLPFVRWVGAFHPAYKLDLNIREAWKKGELESGVFNLTAVRKASTIKTALRHQIETTGGRVLQSSPSGWIVRADLMPSALWTLLHSNEVLAADPWGPPETDMDLARWGAGADYAEQVAGFSGLGVRAEVMDDGLDTSHVDWALPPLLHGSQSGSNNHGTSTYAVNFSSGASNSEVRGMVPDAQGIFADFSFLTDRYAHTAELLQSPYFAVYQSNSWGSPRTTEYTSVSAELDDIVFQNDIVIVQAQSNAGQINGRPQAWSKNVLSVGGVFHFNDTDRRNDAWNGGASIGPATDGRVKPDLASYYDSVQVSNNAAFGGSSAATPIVAGAVGVFHEMWHTGIFGNTPGTSVFDSRPHSTLARALLIHSARQWPSDQNDITRFVQGWGQPYLRTLYSLAGNAFWVDETDVLQNLQSKAYGIPVPGGTAEFRATLVYMDRAGTVGSTVHRVNDLSLKATDPNGVVYWGNHGLISGDYNWSEPGGTADVINPVENIFLQEPVVGMWTIEVFADEINEDSHVETPQLDADFALVVSGLPASACTDSIHLSGPAYVQPGFSASFSYTDAPANATFGMVYSFAEVGAQLPGLCLEIGPQVILAGTGVTGAGGAGVWNSPTIPLNASGRVAYLEMVVPQGAAQQDSNHLRVKIQ